MNDALIISGLTKTYKDFMLNGVSFSVPCGSIVGLIGENGAGKSTTINAVLGLIQKVAGSICVLGKEQLDNEIKEQIGVVFDGNNYPEIFSTRKLNRVMKNVYHSWEEHTFLNLLKKFSLPTDKPIPLSSKYKTYLQSKTAVLDTGKTSETFFQPEFLSIFIVVTEIIPSITVAITVKTHVEVKKDIPIPTTAKTTSMIYSTDLIK